MERRVLGGLPALLATLGACPNPDEVITAVIDGPAGRLGATAGILLVLEGDGLRLIGSHGYGPEELAGFDVIPLAADLPIAQAAREGEPIASESSVAITEYAGLRRDLDRWHDLRGRRRYGAIVSVPIVAEGSAVGAYGFTCGEERAWTTQDVSLLEAVGAALALWFVHPDSGLVHGLPAAVAPGASTPRLTDRQVAILQQAAQGRTTAAIARALDYSESTVKHDLRRALLALDCPDRACALARARDLGLLPAGGA